MSKTVAILFGPTLYKKTHLHIRTIEWYSNAKYLGITLDHAMTLNLHVNNTIQKARGARVFLYSILNRNSPIPLYTRLPFTFI